MRSNDPITLLIPFVPPPAVSEMLGFTMPGFVGVNVVGSRNGNPGLVAGPSDTVGVSEDFSGVPGPIGNSATAGAIMSMCRTGTVGISDQPPGLTPPTRWKSLVHMVHTPDVPMGITATTSAR